MLAVFPCRREKAAQTKSMLCGHQPHFAWAIRLHPPSSFNGVHPSKTHGQLYYNLLILYFHSTIYSSNTSYITPSRNKFSKNISINQAQLLQSIQTRLDGLYTTLFVIQALDWNSDDDKSWISTLNRDSRERYCFDLYNLLCKWMVAAFISMQNIDRFVWT